MNVYPSLAGLTFPVTRTPIFKNLKTESVTGRVVTATYMQYPLFEFALSYDYLSAADLKLLEGLFVEMGGDLTGFYFDAGPGDDTVSAQGIGSGDGATTSFQLFQANPGTAVPVDSSFGARTAYVNGGAVAATFESPSPGWVTFVSAPANGAALTWSGQYYYKCRFKQGSQDFDEFMHLLYSTKSVILRTYK